MVWLDGDVSDEIRLAALTLTKDSDASDGLGTSRSRAGHRFFKCRLDRCEQRSIAVRLFQEMACACRHRADYVLLER